MTTPYRTRWGSSIKFNYTAKSTDYEVLWNEVGSQLLQKICTSDLRHYYWNKQKFEKRKHWPVKQRWNRNFPTTSGSFQCQRLLKTCNWLTRWKQYYKFPALQPICHNIKRRSFGTTAIIRVVTTGSALAHPCTKWKTVMSGWLLRGVRF